MQPRQRAGRDGSRCRRSIWRRARSRARGREPPIEAAPETADARGAGSRAVAPAPEQPEPAPRAGRTVPASRRAEPEAVRRAVAGRGAAAGRRSRSRLEVPPSRRLPETARRPGRCRAIRAGRGAGETGRAPVAPSSRRCRAENRRCRSPRRCEDTARAEICRTPSEPARQPPTELVAESADCPPQAAPAAGKVTVARKVEQKAEPVAPRRSRRRGAPGSSACARACRAPRRSCPATSPASSPSASSTRRRCRTWKTC